MNNNFWWKKSENRESFVFERSMQSMANKLHIISVYSVDFSLLLVITTESWNEAKEQFDFNEEKASTILRNTHAFRKSLE